MAQDIPQKTNKRLTSLSDEEDAGPKSLPNLHFFTDVCQSCPFAGHDYSKRQQLCKINIDDLQLSRAAHLPRDADQPLEGSISDVHKHTHGHHYHHHAGIVPNYRPRAQSWDSHEPPITRWKLKKKKQHADSNQTKPTETFDDLELEFTKLTCDIRKLSMDLPKCIPEDNVCKEKENNSDQPSDTEDGVFDLDV